MPTDFLSADTPPSKAAILDPQGPRAHAHARRPAFYPADHPPSLAPRPLDAGWGPENRKFITDFKTHHGFQNSSRAFKTHHGIFKTHHGSDGPRGRDEFPMHFRCIFRFIK